MFAIADSLNLSVNLIKLADSLYDVWNNWQIWSIIVLLELASNKRIGSKSSTFFLIESRMKEEEKEMQRELC